MRFSKVEKIGKKKKAENVGQGKKLITSSSHIQISKEKIYKKVDKQRFLVGKFEMTKQKW